MGRLGALRAGLCDVIVGLVVAWVRLAGDRLCDPGAGHPRGPGQSALLTAGDVIDCGQAFVSVCYGGIGRGISQSKKRKEKWWGVGGALHLTPSIKSAIKIIKLRDFKSCRLRIPRSNCLETNSIY